ncbi:hypothetical protein ACFPYN_07510 [Paenisporosarcina macmurdoensis]|uniref:Uncharacterized protein n=1 Tax=Paenisporosarcina macmurdoensis TaxID=212659 RepID=A0ABW1L6U3_9BACL
MISTKLMDKHQVITVWSCSKKEEPNTVGFVKAYLGECADGCWLAVTTDSSWEESEVFLLHTRPTALKRKRQIMNTLFLLKENAFLTFVRKAFSIS